MIWVFFSIVGFLYWSRHELLRRWKVVSLALTLMRDPQPFGSLVERSWTAVSQVVFNEAILPLLAGSHLIVWSFLELILLVSDIFKGRDVSIARSLIWSISQLRYFLEILYSLSCWCRYSLLSKSFLHVNWRVIQQPLLLTGVLFALITYLRRQGMLMRYVYVFYSLVRTADRNWSMHSL